MKKVILALVAVAVVGWCTASAEAGHRYGRRAVRTAWYPPVVRVQPRFVAPVVVPVARPMVAPVIVRRPAYYYDPFLYRGPSIFVGGGYHGSGVHVRVPGFGLDVRY